MLRPVSEVAEMETQLGPASRYVDPVSQYRPAPLLGFRS